MSCDEKRRLATEYETTTATFALTKWSSKHGIAEGNILPGEFLMTTPVDQQQAFKGLIEVAQWATSNALAISGRD